MPCKARPLTLSLSGRERVKLPSLSILESTNLNGHRHYLRNTDAFISSPFDI